MEGEKCIEKRGANYNGSPKGTTIELEKGVGVMGFV